MANLRLLPPAWVTEVSSLGYGMVRSRALMTDEWAAGVLYGIERNTGTLKWQAEPEWPRWRMKPIGAEKHVLVAEGNATVYRFDITTGEPLWIHRGSEWMDTSEPLWVKQGAEWMDRFDQWIDRRNLRTVEKQVQPFAVKNGEIIGYCGTVLSIQTGLKVRQAEQHDFNRTLNALNSGWRPGVYDVEANVGTLYYGTPGKVRLPDGKREWFLRRPDDTIAWSWEASSLNEVIGADTDAAFFGCSFEPYKTFMFLLLYISAEKKGYSNATYAFLAVQDLRNGEIIGIQKISDVPLRSPKIDFIDDKGVLVRAEDAEEAVKQEPKKKYGFTLEDKQSDTVRLFYLPLTD